MRKDLYTAKLGLRYGEKAKRIFLEDTANRLSRNGFMPDMHFVPVNRMGPGLDFRLNEAGSLKINQRRGVSLLSYDNMRVAERFPVDDVIVRISVGLISIVPSTRVFSVRTISEETWTLADNNVATPAGTFSAGLGAVIPSGRPSLLRATITDADLISATDFITRLKPAKVEITATGLAFLTASNFLTACGWTMTAPGFFQL